MVQKRGAPAEKGGAKAPPGLFLVQSGGTAEKGQIGGAPRPYFGPKWGARPKRVEQTRRPGLFWSKVGGTAEEGRANTSPGRISVQSRGHGRNRAIGGAAWGFFCSKVGGNRQERRETRAGDKDDGSSIKLPQGSRLFAIRHHVLLGVISVSFRSHLQKQPPTLDGRRAFL